METKLMHLSQVPSTSGAPTSYLKSERLAGRHERRLAKTVGITQFGANHVVLEPGAMTALRHWHEAEDEFIYVLSGTVTLIDDNGDHEMGEGAFAGFPAGYANAHHLINKSRPPYWSLAPDDPARKSSTIPMMTSARSGNSASLA